MKPGSVAEDGDYAAAGFVLRYAPNEAPQRCFTANALPAWDFK